MIRAEAGRPSGLRYDLGVPQAGATARALTALQTEHRACHRCVDAGFIPSALPVFSGTASQRVLLVGQAPGPVEQDQSRPFAGRAGRQLMRWFVRAGFAGDSDVRARVYMTAMTTCFPGRRADGAGDRRPSGREVALCSPWLDALLDVLRPRLILPVGGLALSRFLPGRNLDDVIGSAYAMSGERLKASPSSSPVLLPLPHPSGQSRWLNDPDRAALLDEALRRLADLVEWAEDANPLSGIGAEAMV
jgi:uracil-DNA glycosylase